MGSFGSTFQFIKGIEQYNDAYDLKEAKVSPELYMNRDAATQQAHSRRSPGSAYAEEMIRRNQSNQIGAALRMYGGDANKVAAISSSAGAQANDATARLQAQGQAFSEDAFKRLYMANTSVAQEKRRNREEYLKAKANLLQASDQNISGAISLGDSFGS